MKGDTTYYVESGMYKGESIDDVLAKVCECGHTLGQHAHTWLPVSAGPMTYVTSQCMVYDRPEDGKKIVPCSCSQFREA